MDRFSRYGFRVEPFSEDFLGNLSWRNLGNYILQCASRHAGEHGFGYSQMIAQHHVWVLSRLVVEMDSLPRTGEDFSIETWVDSLYRQFTNRHFSILHPDGTPYGHATSIWALIDTISRQPADLTTLPDGGFTSALIPERTSPIAPMGRRRMKQPETVYSHRAAYTDLDINGHVNSIRYIEMMLDTFSADILKEHPVRRIEAAFCLESYAGDMLHILREAEEGDARKQIFEIRNDKENIVFKGSVELC